MARNVIRYVGLILCTVGALPASADTTVLFDASQFAMVVDSGVTSDTMATGGYLFTYTRDKLFTGGTGHIIGRQESVSWPAGLEAQAITTPPPGVTNHHAKMTITRADGNVFDLPAFSMKILANTGGAGATLEIMPLLDGEDAFVDPVFFQATGYWGQVFSYDTTTPSYLGNTALLTGFDTYQITLYVDFAITAITFDCAAIPGDFDGNAFVDQADYSVMGFCVSGPGDFVRPAGCSSVEFAIADIDHDLDVDLADFADFSRRFMR